ncbi:30S ribosomal protein S17 [archaeon]|nr:30S ribosomal protein S17 [archaeon]
MEQKLKNIGIEVKAPSKECNDKKCPFHGDVKLRGRIFNGIVIKKDTHKSLTIEFPRLLYLYKYERYEKRRSRIRAHNPECINAQIGDKVKIIETKPLSKTKKFVVVEVVK